MADLGPVGQAKALHKLWRMNGTFHDAERAGELHKSNAFKRLLNNIADGFTRAGLVGKFVLFAFSKNKFAQTQLQWRIMNMFSDVTEYKELRDMRNLRMNASADTVRGAVYSSRGDDHEFRAHLQRSLKNDNDIVSLSLTGRVAFNPFERI